MIHARLSERVESSDIAALHRGELPAGSPLRALFDRAEVRRSSPTDPLSDWEVSALSPNLTRVFELSFDSPAAESAAEIILGRSPLVASVEYQTVRVCNLPRPPLGESEEELRRDRGAMESLALGCGILTLGFTALGLLLGIGAVLAGSF